MNSKHSVIDKITINNLSGFGVMRSSHTFNFTPLLIKIWRPSKNYLNHEENEIQKYIR